MVGSMFLVERPTIPLGEVHYSIRIFILLYSLFLRRCVTYLILYGSECYLNLLCYCR